MPIYSVKLGEAAASAGAVTVFDTPADGAVYVVRDIILSCSSSGGADEAFVYDTAGTYFLFETSTGFASFHWVGRQILAPGELISLDAATGSWSCRISGYRLT